ncbi:hypothetical protein RMATCC62417_17245 [Rhizopus microsporus]|nr:hypothetical protein RMATCC62417_17245 [Rhizopus microsporus]
MASLVDRTQDVDMAQKYIFKVKSETGESKKLVRLIPVVIHIIDLNPFQLDPENNHRVIEYDYLTQIWVPLIQAIVNVHGTLRIRVGESSPKSGTLARKRVYDEVNVGFKEDI